MKYFVAEPRGDVPEVYSDVDAWADEVKAQGVTSVNPELVQSCFHNGIQKMDLGAFKFYTMEG